MSDHDTMNQEGNDTPLAQKEEVHETSLSPNDAGNENSLGENEEDASETGLTREDSLKRSAQMKAAVIALLNNAETPVSRTFLNDQLQPLLTELDYKPNHFDNLLYTLAKNGLIKKLGKNVGGAGYLYAGDKYNGPLETSKVTGKPVRKYTKRANKVESLPEPKPAVENLPATTQEVDNVQTERINRLPEPGAHAAVTVDIVKSSGRIRVAIGGISIEIGVVD